MRLFNAEQRFYCLFNEAKDGITSRYPAALYLPAKFTIPATRFSFRIYRSSHKIFIFNYLSELVKFLLLIYSSKLFGGNVMNHHQATLCALVQEQSSIII